MRETTGTTTTMKMGLAFTILFAAFLAVAITYNRAYKVKNELTNILQKYEGPTEQAIEIINNYLSNNSYADFGRCNHGDFGIRTFNDRVPELARSDTDYIYCLSQTCPDNAAGACKVSGKVNQKIFYTATVFFKFNLPFFGEIAVFKISGQTKGVKLYDSFQIMK